MTVVTEFVAKLVVVSATGLPQTDRLSKIDAYIVLTLPGGQKLRTKTMDDNQAPVWNQVFYPVLAKHPSSGFLGSTIGVELFDENVFKDSLVATASIQLEGFKTPHELLLLNLPLALRKSKHTGSPVLQLRFEAFVQSYFSIKNMYSVVPGFLFNETVKACYIPIPEFQGLLYMAVEFEAGELDLKVYYTQPHGQSIYVDMVNQAGSMRTKAIRRSYPKGRALCPGLTVYEEVKLDDIPFATDFSKLSVVVFQSTPLSSVSAAQIVKAHGWRGSLDFQGAAQTLHGVLIDHKAEEIYMQVDPNETMLLVDYDEDDADIKLAVLSNPSTADKGYDLTIRGQDCKKYSEVYLPYKSKLGGQVLVSRLFELDDVDYGTSFGDIQINRFQLRNPRTFTVQDLTRIMG